MAFQPLAGMGTWPCSWPPLIWLYWTPSRNQVMVSAFQSLGVRSHSTRHVCQSVLGMETVLGRPMGSLHGPPLVTLLQWPVPWPMSWPFMRSMMSSSPQPGQSMVWARHPWPMTQKAGQMPCCWSTGLLPKRIRASARVFLPAVGMNVYLDSMRPDVHLPLLSFRGVMIMLWLPVFWMLAGSFVYVSTSLLIPSQPEMTFHLSLSWLGPSGRTPLS